MNDTFSFGVFFSSSSASLEGERGRSSHNEIVIVAQIIKEEVRVLCEEDWNLTVEEKRYFIGTPPILFMFL
jgi:hypothetical protein